MLPAAAQKTTNYRALGQTLAGQSAGDWALHGLLLVGANKAVRGLTADFKLWGAS